jgi:hypothetical protein
LFLVILFTGRLAPNYGLGRAKGRAKAITVRCASPIDTNRSASMIWGVLDIDRRSQILADFPGFAEAEFSMGASDQRIFNEPIACSAKRDRNRKGSER